MLPPRVQDKEKDDPPPAEEPPSFLELFMQIYPQPQDKESPPFLELGQTDLQPPEDLQGQATERSPSSATDRSRSETSSAQRESSKLEPHVNISLRMITQSRTLNQTKNAI